jgi:predicted dehydrogenase
MSDTIRVLVVGCGNMGASHARAYHTLDGFEIVGVVSRGPETRGKLSSELGGLEQFDNFYTALDATKPDAVSISTLPDTHAEFALKSLESGAHVFVEKPIALTVEQAESVKQTALRLGKKSGSGIYSEAASLVDAIHREGTDTRKTACHAHEPQSAK